MPKTVVPLTDTLIKSLKAETKPYTRSDGQGLHLLVRSDGSKLWEFIYTSPTSRKRRKTSFGLYPATTLAVARKKRQEHKEKISHGIDPIDDKKQQKEEVQKQNNASSNTFKIVAMERLSKEQAKISESHYKRTLRGFTNDIFPVIGNKPIDDIEAADIITILQTMTKRGVQNSAQKVYQSISKTFKWAVANGKAKRNPAADIDASEVIGTINVTNYATVTDDAGIKKLLKAISTYDGELSTKNALLMLAHVVTRPTNVIHAEWSEIDLKKKQWVIPASKMKTKKEHIVPLTDTVIKIIDEMKLLSTGKYLFPNTKSKDTPLSNGTMRMALRRQGITKEEFTPHGFRAMFSTIAHEKSGFSHEVIETQLAHSVGTNVSQAYNRAKYLPKRLKMMQWWSDYLENLQRTI